MEEIHDYILKFYFLYRVPLELRLQRVIFVNAKYVFVIIYLSSNSRKLALAADWEHNKWYRLVLEKDETIMNMILNALGSQSYLFIFLPRCYQSLDALQRMWKY